MLPAKWQQLYSDFNVFNEIFFLLQHLDVGNNLLFPDSIKVATRDGHVSKLVGLYWGLLPWTFGIF